MGGLDATKLPITGCLFSPYRFFVVRCGFQSCTQVSFMHRPPASRVLPESCISLHMKADTIQNMWTRHLIQSEQRGKLVQHKPESHFVQRKEKSRKRKIESKIVSLCMCVCLRGQSLQTLPNKTETCTNQPSQTSFSYILPRIWTVSVDFVAIL